jgi:hypothetical protein
MPNGYCSFNPQTTNALSFVVFVPLKSRLPAFLVDLRSQVKVILFELHTINRLPGASTGKANLHFNDKMVRSFVLFSYKWGCEAHSLKNRQAQLKTGELNPPVHK